jgi:hypothetical protein
MTESKTTKLRNVKTSQLQRVMGNLLYFILNHKKQNLRIIKDKDMKAVLRITELWKSELIEYQKFDKNSNTDSHHQDDSI